MRLFETIEGIGSPSVLCLIRMYEEGLLAVGPYDVGFRNTRLEIEDIVGIVLESFQNSCRVSVICASNSVPVQPVQAQSQVSSSSHPQYRLLLARDSISLQPLFAEDHEAQSGFTVLRRSDSRTNWFSCCGTSYFRTTGCSFARMWSYS